MANRELYFVRVVKAFADKRGISQRRIVVIVSVIVAAVMLFYLLVGPYGIVNIIRINSERKVLEQKLVDLSLERDTLVATIKNLKTDRKTIEKIAREHYGMAKKGEQVYKIVPADTGGFVDTNNDTTMLNK